MKDPVDHILRPLLPWRSEGLTECGLDGAKVSAVTREQYFKRLKDLGQRRTAIMTCMTCASTAERWKSWDQDPREAIGREVAWETGYTRSTGKRNGPLRQELTAIATLVDLHREEFEALIQEISDREEWIKRKAEAAAPKPSAAGAWYPIR